MVIFPSSGYIPRLVGRLPDSTWRANGVAGQTATYPLRESAPEIPTDAGFNDHPETWPRCGWRHGLVRQISRGQLRGLPTLAVAAHKCWAGSW
jgi:hypothetical protein